MERSEQTGSNDGTAAQQSSAGGPRKSGVRECQRVRRGKHERLDPECSRNLQ